MNQQTLSAFIWSVADLLRGDYKQSDYGKVILPFTVLRRLDCVLEATKLAVLAELAAKKAQGVNPEPFLLRKAGQSFYNIHGPLAIRGAMRCKPCVGLMPRPHPAGGEDFGPISTSPQRPGKTPPRATPGAPRQLGGVRSRPHFLI